MRDVEVQIITTKMKGREAAIRPQSASRYERNMMAKKQKSGGMKMYYFAGRNTPVVANSAAAARKRKKRGGSKIVAVRKPSAADRKTMRKGKWVTTRRDGKSKAKSKYGKGRGKGPKRSKKN